MDDRHNVLASVLSYQNDLPQAGRVTHSSSGLISDVVKDSSAVVVSLATKVDLEITPTLTHPPTDANSNIGTGEGGTGPADAAEDTDDVSDHKYSTLVPIP